LKQAGIVVMSMCGTVAHARKAEQAGCDVVIAQGTEGGGHTGKVASVALWPQVVDAVSIPVIAAGGLFDGRGLVAALALGCQGVWMGTRFIASHEAHAGAPYKQALVDMTDDSTTISRGFTGKTLRAIANKTTAHFDRHPEELKPFPMQVMLSAQANRLGPIAGIVDNVDVSTMCLAAGQGGGAIREILSCQEIISGCSTDNQRGLAHFETILRLVPY
jgi:enoyl-[acyl-carrier protein] reductase II